MIQTLKRFAGRTIALLLVLVMMLGALPIGAPGIAGVTAASKTVLLVEVFNAGQPAPGQPIEEWVTLANITAQRQDLSGWSIRDYTSSGNFGSSFTIPAGTVMEPYSLLVVEKGVGGFVHIPEGSGVKKIAGGNFNLAGESDRVDLVDNANRLVDGISWGTGNSVEGFSIPGNMASFTSFERLRLSDTDTPADWVSRPQPEAIAWEWAPLGDIPLDGGPKLLVTAPGSGETRAEPGQLVGLEYDRAIAKGFGTIRIFNLSDHTVFASIPVEDPAVTIGSGGRMLHIATERPFESGKRYEVYVPASVVESADGVRGVNVRWTFTVEVESGVTPPPEGFRIEFIANKSVNGAQDEAIGYIGAAPPRATVKLYGQEAGGEPMAETTAGADGSFRLVFDNPEGYKTVYFTAQSGEGTESVRASVNANGVYSTQVASITDGDTIRIGTPILGADRIRLLSIDTPEAAQQYGEMATNILRGLISPGDELIVEVGVEPKDGYGRLLGHLFRKSDGLDITRELIRLGAAVPYFISPNVTYFESYSEATKEARANGRGIWNPAAPLEQLPYEYRFMTDGRGGPDKYVGDYLTKKLYTPAEYVNIPVENRVFFYRNEVNDARVAGYEWAGSGTSPFSELTGEIIPISDAREQTNVVRVRGEVTAAFAENAWIQDSTAGIRLYSSGVAGLKVGDEVDVRGAMAVYQGDKELKNSVVVKLEGDHFPTPEPIVVESLADIGPQHEGSLIRVRDVWIEQSYLQADGGIVISDGTADIIVYAYAGGRMRDYLQSLPQDKKSTFDFVGVSMVFGTTKQLVPRNPGDIIPRNAGGYAPELVTQKPSQLARDVSLHPEVELTFDRRLIKGQGTITVHNALSHQVVAEIAVGSANVILGGLNRNQATVLLPEMLRPNTLYDIAIPAGAFKDAAGNETEQLTISFTTTRAEGPVGTIVGTVRAEGRTDHSAVQLIATNMASGEQHTLSGLVSANGSFSIPLAVLPAGEYRLAASLPHYLPVVKERVVMNAGSSTQAGNLSDLENGGTADGAMRAGELVIDGAIDIYDAALVGKYIGLDSAEALAAADINGDGKVDDEDMRLVRGNLREAALQ